LLFLERAFALATRAENSKDVFDLMNGPIYDKLSATLPYLSPWDSQGGDVFDANWEDFMKPVISQGMQAKQTNFLMKQTKLLN